MWRMVAMKTRVFSLKFKTLDPSKVNDPNLAGGLTAEIVTIFLWLL